MDVREMFLILTEDWTDERREMHKNCPEWSFDVGRRVKGYYNIKPVNQPGFTGIQGLCTIGE